MPTPREYLGAAAAFNGKLYGFGGYLGVALATAQEYDPTANTWAGQPAMAGARHGLGVAMAPDGRLYAIGGTPDDVTYLNRVEQFTPLGPLPPSPTPTPTSTPTLTPTPTPTNTPTPTRTSTPTNTPAPIITPTPPPTSTPPPPTGTPPPTATPNAPCAPRPSVGVVVVPTSPGSLAATITANTTPWTPTNSLTLLQFGAATNALIDVPGQPPSQTGSFTVTLPPGTTSATFTVRRATSGAATTVPVVVSDTCGAWPTFVGGGPDAF
jgi:hypothetical protein